MIENTYEIKYPVIVKDSTDDNFIIYRSLTRGYSFSYNIHIDEPISKRDTICTKEFLQGKYVRVKCVEEFNFLKELSLNGGYTFNCIYDLISKTTYLTFYDGFVVNHSEKSVIGKELLLPFPDSIYQKEDFVSKGFLSQTNRPTTGPLSEEVEQEISTNEGYSIAESLHSLADRYTLFYSFHPKDDSSAGEATLHDKIYFLVDYKDVSYKVDSVAKVGDLEKMIMIEKGLCYE